MHDGVDDADCNDGDVCNGCNGGERDDEPNQVG